MPSASPNVLIILLDDVGFGQASTFGGGINTPTLSKLADQGVNRTNTLAVVVKPMILCLGALFLLLACQVVG